MRAIRETRGVLRHLTRLDPRRAAESGTRIVRRADVWGGKAVIDGTRIPVFMVHSRLQAGWAPAEIREAYPRLTAADVDAVIRYARAYPSLLLEDRLAYERALASEGAR